MSNVNVSWAETLVDALISCQIEHVCISPGSRSTPLTLAFAQRDEITTHIILDERGAGYFALGIAKQSKKPVILVCTSGTAAANYYPAILEAKYSETPLIIITADRPHVLRDSGANQTIDQIKMYGNNVKWFVDLPVPDSTDKSSYLQSIACRAVASAKLAPAGPIHLNFPFTKPLQPLNEQDLGIISICRNIFQKQADIQIAVGDSIPTSEQLQYLMNILQEKRKGIIICGPMHEQESVSTIIRFAEKLHFPIFADILSGLRFNDLVIATYESFFQNEENYGDPPELILFFGAVPISKYLHKYLEANISAKCIRISSSPMWRDDIYALNYTLQADVKYTLNALLQKIQIRGDNPLYEYFQTLELKFKRLIRTYLQKNTNFGANIIELLTVLPTDSQLFLANSLTIRYFDQFAFGTKLLHIFGNRGVSGIDGNIATATGLAATGQFTTVVIGDLAFLHDIGSVILAQKYKLRIIIMNNSGGGIFSRLPIFNYPSYFYKYFQTPQQVNFEGVKQLFNIRYHKIHSFVQLLEQYKKDLGEKETIIYEITTSIDEDQRYLDKFVLQIRD